MNDQITKVQTEKHQLATKVTGLEQIVLQLSMFQTQRSNFDGNVKANMFEQQQRGSIGSQFNLNLGNSA